MSLIDYLTEADGGMGEDRDIMFPPTALAQWMAEADLCDADVGGRARYQTAGFYQFDNAPESVIGKLLASMDGWLGEAGDGSLVLTVGVYREPTDPPLTADHIKGFSWRKGVADEESVNQLDITFTNPAAGYVSDQIASIRDEDAISLAGIVRAKPLDLSWVQNADQAAALGERAMLRLNPKRSGSFVTTLYGMRYLGKRWIKVQHPLLERGAVCVVEIQDKCEVDLLGGRVTINWNLVDPVALAALN
ncbi:phage tail protein [Bradyrhizobium sp. S3.14.4]